MRHLLQSEVRQIEVKYIKGDIEKNENRTGNMHRLSEAEMLREL